MTPTTRVDLHCHSEKSDGALSPRELAERLSAAGVAFAALTDHDTLEGLGEFREALSRREIGSIAGVEMTAQYRGSEAHLLGYGFDPESLELQAALQSLRDARVPPTQSIEDSVRLQTSRSAERAGAAANGRIGIAEAIELIHRAGGRAFLAHPLVLQSDRERLRDMLVELKGMGLDGLEAIYGPYAEPQRQGLVDLADELGLLVSAGSDGHERHGRLGVPMPTERWRRFRDAVCCGPASGSSGAVSAVQQPRFRMRRRHFLFHVVFPTLLAMGLFAVAIFGVFFPALERSLLDRKREMIRELTQSAWSILAGYERDHQAGTLSAEQAREMAKTRIELLRYGRDGKDYFWLQDMQPRIVMHPYRKDLNGRDVSDYKDPRGVRIFVEFAQVVRRQHEGYVDYVWQWKDDPNHVAPKESYVKGFEPWGWIIGTGIYTEDVQRESALLQRRLVRVSVGISVVVALLLLYVLRQSLRLERQRSEAEEGLRDSTERYRSLVEATTEGALLVLDGRCRYGNPVLLDLLGCSAQDLELLDLEDVIPPGAENETVWESMTRVVSSEEAAGGVEAVLRRRDGRPLECVVTLNPIVFGGRRGVIVLAKPVGLTTSGSRDPGPAAARGEGLLEQLSESLTAGVFRATATAHGSVVACSRAAARLLSLGPDAAAGAPLTLSGLFADPAAYEGFLSDLRRDGSAERHLHLATDTAETTTIALGAVLQTSAPGEGPFIDGVIQDVSSRERRQSERDAQIRRLQASMLFLHEPVGDVARLPVFCELDCSARAAADAMTTNGAAEVLVRAGSGEVVGIVTDRDLRQRILAGGLDLQTPVYRIMSSPLVAIAAHANVYEALLTMEQHGVHHVAVEDHAGQVTGVIRSQELLQFHDYGPIVLTRDIARSETPRQVVTSCRRAPGLARVVLDSGGHPGRVTHMLTSACDAAAERFGDLAATEPRPGREPLGAAPVPFAFLALGSHGREELVLSSDQDNALLYADSPGAPAAHAAYFQAVGESVCDWLAEAGYPPCRGGVMAKTPRWCQPMSVWKGYFTEWIRRAEAQEILQFSIFFDFRPVFGDGELADELRRHVHETIAAHPLFLTHLSQQVLQFRGPLRLFGRILGAASPGDRPGQVNLKDAMAPIVAHARLYALRHGLQQTNTLERLNALEEAGAIVASSRDDTVAAYELLTRLRLEHQAALLDSGHPPGNVVDYRRLRPPDQALLNQAFAQIAALQQRIGHEFGAAT